MGSPASRAGSCSDRGPRAADREPVDDRVLSTLYAAIARRRRERYASRPDLRRRLRAPVISVGNLAVGGRGKTPMAARVAEWAQGDGLPVAILSRGYAGSFAGDNLFVSSVELRVPVSSAMGVGRLGINVFADAGAVYDHGGRLRDATFHRGFGAGIFSLAAIIQLNLEVAHGVDGDTRVHFRTGFSF